MAKGNNIEYDDIKGLLKVLDINPREFWLECTSAIGYWPEVPERMWPKVDIVELAELIDKGVNNE